MKEIQDQYYLKTRRERQNRKRASINRTYRRERGWADTPKHSRKTRRDWLVLADQLAD